MSTSQVFSACNRAEGACATPRCDAAALLFQAGPEGISPGRFRALGPGPGVTSARLRAGLAPRAGAEQRAGGRGAVRGAGWDAWAGARGGCAVSSPAPPAPGLAAGAAVPSG